MSEEKSENGVPIAIGTKSVIFNSVRPYEHFPEDKGAREQRHPVAWGIKFQTVSIDRSCYQMPVEY